MAPLGFPAQPRFHYLDGLRGVAALMIVVHHFTLSSGHREIFASASIAVDFFFCLSGFVIANGYHARLQGPMNVGEYVRRRVRRLYPLYAVGLVLGLVALLAMKWEGLTDMTWWEIALAAVLNALYIPSPNDAIVQVYALPVAGAIFPLNNPAWSLFFGMLANLAYAVTVRHTRFRPALWMAVSAVGLLAAGYAFGTTPGWGTANVAGGLPRVLYAFFAGVAVYLALPRLARLPVVPVAPLLAVTVVLLGLPRFDGFHYYWLFDALVVVPLLVALGTRCRVVQGTALQCAFSYSGRISYAIFCVHYPLLMAYSVLVPVDPAYPLVAASYLALVLLTAHTAMRWFEGRRPALPFAGMAAP